MRIGASPKSANHPLTLGPFRALRPLGAGGMAEVWRGVHETSHTDVALKIITTRKAENPRFIDTFRREVRAVASLYHPNIVQVFDTGQISLEVETLSRGRLVAGHPWLAMELVSGGSLTRRCGAYPWQDVMGWVVSLLDALAHAHARGVIHLDLKPDNILFAGDTDARPGLKLLDFGIAHAMTEPSRGGQDGLRTTLLAADNDDIAGTLAYMAPEQLLGDWRDFGPWTDLYALGHITWQLVTGAPPFANLPVARLVQAQCFEAPGSFVPVVDVPRGLERWLRQLLEKVAERRFQRAADARWALLELGQVQDVTVRIPRPSPHPPPSEENPTERHLRGELLRDVPLARESGTLQPAHQPPFPPQWRGLSTPARGRVLAGSGLGLYGLRHLPMVGREAERDVLWHLLQQVHETKSSRVVVIEGGPGQGKSRLAEWLTEVSHEVGVATALKAVHGPEGGPADGIIPMLSRFLRTPELELAEVVGRVQATLQARGATDPWDWQTLGKLICPEPWPTSGAGQDAPTEGHSGHLSTRARFTLVSRTLQVLAAQRPLVLWLDDAQWGADALHFTRFVLDQQADTPLPALIVLTVQSDALVSRPLEQTALRFLLPLPGVTHLPLSPLPLEQHRHLVTELLGLSGELLEQVVSRTSGNPLFAIQVVGEWVQRRLLIPGVRGFTLAPGARVEVPLDLADTWRVRLDRAFAGCPPEWRLATEVMAILGESIDLTEWRSVCGSLDLPTDRRIVEALVQADILISHSPGPTGQLSFVHPVLRRILEQESREQGRHVTWHRACARMLDDRYYAMAPGIAERRTHHREQAGDWMEACTALRWVSRSAVDSGQLELARASLDRANHLLKTPGWSPSAQDRLMIHLAHVALLFFERRINEYITLARELEPCLHDTSLGLEGVRAFSFFARSFLLSGDIDTAQRHYHRGLEVVRRRRDSRGEVMLGFGLSECYRHQGQIRKTYLIAMEIWKKAHESGERLTEIECLKVLCDTLGELRLYDDAEFYLRMLSAIADELGSDLHRAFVPQLRGRLALRRRDWPEAEREFRRCLAVYQRLGDPLGMAQVLLDLGDTQRLLGDFAQGEQSIREASRLFSTINLTRHNILPYALAMVLTLQDKDLEAREVLERGLRDLSSPGIQCGYHLLFTLLAAKARDWSQFDSHMAAVSQHLPHLDTFDRDDAFCATQAGKLALKGNQKVRATAILRLGAKFWKGLEDEEQQREVDHLLRQTAR